MKALVLTESKKLEYITVDDPIPGEYEVLVRVRACGICGSDVHGYDGSTGRRIPPIIMGHEASGEIEALGDSIEKWKTGDRVTFDSTIYCNKCSFCHQGMINLCNNRRVLGVSCEDYRQNGAFAEYVTIPQHILFKLPDEVSYEQACLVEPLSIAFHAVGLSQINISDTVIVVGAGMIGLLIIQTLRMVGCGNLIAVDIDEKKLQLAKNLGADYCLLSVKEKVRDHALKITDGIGADAAFDAVGINSSLEVALSGIRKGGQITLVGNLAPSVDLPLQNIVTKQIRMQGSCASSGEYKACLDMIARNNIDIDLLISKVTSLEEGQKWFDVLYKGNSDLLKVILKP